RQARHLRATGARRHLGEDQPHDEGDGHDAPHHRPGGDGQKGRWPVHWRGFAVARSHPAAIHSANSTPRPTWNCVTWPIRLLRLGVFADCCEKLKASHATMPANSATQTAEPITMARLRLWSATPRSAPDGWSGVTVPVARSRCRRRTAPATIMTT